MPLCLHWCWFLFLFFTDALLCEGFCLQLAHPAKDVAVEVGRLCRGRPFRTNQPWKLESKTARPSLPERSGRNQYCKRASARIPPSQGLLPWAACRIDPQQPAARFLFPTRASTGRGEANTYETKLQVVCHGNFVGSWQVAPEASGAWNVVLRPHQRQAWQYFSLRNDPGDFPECAAAMARCPGGTTGFLECVQVQRTRQSAGGRATTPPTGWSTSGKRLAHDVQRESVVNCPSFLICQAARLPGDRDVWFRARTLTPLRTLSQR